MSPVSHTFLLPVRVTVFGVLAAIYFAATALSIPAIWLLGVDLSRDGMVDGLTFLLLTMVAFWIVERFLTPAPVNRV